MHRTVLNLTFQKESSKCDHDKLIDENRNINHNFSKLTPLFPNSSNAFEILLHHSNLDEESLANCFSIQSSILSSVNPVVVIYYEYLGYL